MNHRIAKIATNCCVSVDVCCVDVACLRRATYWVTALRTNFRKVVDKHTIDMNRRWLCTRLPYRTGYTAKSRPDSRLYALLRLENVQCGVDVCHNLLQFRFPVPKIHSITYICSKNSNI